MRRFLMAAALICAVGGQGAQALAKSADSWAGAGGIGGPKPAVPAAVQPAQPAVAIAPAPPPPPPATIAAPQPAEASGINGAIIFGWIVFVLGFAGFWAGVFAPRGVPRRAIGFVTMAALFGMGALILAGENALPAVNSLWPWGLGLIALMAFSTLADTAKQPPAPRAAKAGPFSTKLEITALLQYIDGDGQPSERTVTLHTISGHRYRDGTVTVEAFDAWCHLRQAMRSFRIDRIVNLANPTTGEVAEAPADVLAIAAGLTPHIVRPRTPGKRAARLR